MSLWDDLAKEDAARVEATRAEIAKEKAEWDALSDEEKAARITAVEAKYLDAPDCDELERCEDCGLVIAYDGYCEACEA